MAICWLLIGKMLIMYFFICEKVNVKGEKWKKKVKSESESEKWKVRGKNKIWIEKFNFGFNEVKKVDPNALIHTCQYVDP